MSDIIVTTPKNQMANAAREAADCIAAGGGEYFRRFPWSYYPRIRPGERVYYVEDGYVRGYAVVSRVLHSPTGQTCDTTGRRWPAGFYVFMDAATWRWIRPIPMHGFQGFRYAAHTLMACEQVVDVGGWLDRRPEVTR